MAETAENLCLGFGCWGKGFFAKVSGRLKISFRRPDTVRMGLLFWKSAGFFGRFLLGFVAAQKFDGGGFFGFVAVFGITLGAA